MGGGIILPFFIGHRFDFLSALINFCGYKLFLQFQMEWLKCCGILNEFVLYWISLAVPPGIVMNSLGKIN